MGRGPSPRDPALFHENQSISLSAAIFDLCFLLGRDYPESSALQSVGNRYQLRERQRLAIMRCATDWRTLPARHDKECTALAGQTLAIDGFNLVILLEAACGGGPIFHAADGCFRDLSSIHGNYRMVKQTADVIESIGHWLATQQVAAVEWWFDAPVSNSGRLVTLVRELAEAHQWSWTAQTSSTVDQVIIDTPHVAISSDQIILNRCQRWANAGKMLVEALAPDAWILTLPLPRERDALRMLDGLDRVSPVIPS